jgi:RNA polymerase sigma-70 factor, ECF subfamily
MDERKLIEAIRARDDHDAFRQLVDLYATRVHGLVASILGPFTDLDAENVAQEVFMKVYLRLSQFRGDSAFGSWVYAIAYRTALEARRGARIRLPHVELEDSGGTVDHDARLMVATAMEKLPDMYRTALSLHYWLGMSVDEMAGLLNVPTGTVKSYLSRARERMRRALDS